MNWTEEDLSRHLHRQKRAHVTTMHYPSQDPREAAEEYRRGLQSQAVQPPVSKYRSRRTQVGELWFDSKREADRYQDLKLLEHAGAIKNLELQPRFDLIASNGEVCGHYRADFRYVENGTLVIEDVKGGPATKTTAYRLRKRWAEACHGIRIVEV